MKPVRLGLKMVNIKVPEDMYDSSHEDIFDGGKYLISFYPKHQRFVVFNLFNGQQKQESSVNNTYIPFRFLYYHGSCKTLSLTKLLVLDNEHVFATNIISKKLSFAILKLDWENGSFQLMYEVADNSFDFTCHFDILRGSDYLIANLDRKDMTKHCFLKFDLNIYKIEKYREINIPSTDHYCHGLFEDRLLFFRRHDLLEEDSSIILCWLDPNSDQLNKFKIKLPYGFELQKVDFFNSTNMI